MSKRSDYVAARRARVEPPPLVPGVPRLVPLFPIAGQPLTVCPHHGPMPLYTRLVCMACHQTGGVYERRIRAELQREQAKQRAAEEERDAQRKRRLAEARRRRLSRGAPELVKAG